MKHEVIHLKDVFPFLGEDGCDPTLETFLPYNMKEMNRQNDKRPCIIVCPGGAYYMCSEREAEPVALNFLTAGYNAFVLTYSCNPHLFPTALRQVAAVMELIYAHAEDWNCDTSRIAIVGFSAGGHLAAHYSNAFDCPEVREVFPESKPVNATVLGYPVISADPAFGHMESFNLLLGHLPNEEEKARFSCDRLVRDITPPTFLWHTAEDNVVPVKNSLVYAQALAEHHVPFELHIYPQGPHGLSTADSLTCDGLDPKVCVAHGWLDDARRWLTVNL